MATIKRTSGQNDIRYMEIIQGYRNVSALDTVKPGLLTLGTNDVINAKSTRWAFDNVLHVSVILPAGVTAARVSIYSNSRVTTSLEPTTLVTSLVVDDVSAWCKLKDIDITETSIITLTNFPPSALYVTIPTATGTLSVAAPIQIDYSIAR